MSCYDSECPACAAGDIFDDIPLEPYLPKTAKEARALGVLLADAYAAGYGNGYDAGVWDGIEGASPEDYEQGYEDGYDAGYDSLQKKFADLQGIINDKFPGCVLQFLVSPRDRQAGEDLRIRQITSPAEEGCLDCAFSAIETTLGRRE